MIVIQMIFIKYQKNFFVFFYKGFNEFLVLHAKFLDYHLHLGLFDPIFSLHHVLSCSLGFGVHFPIFLSALELDFSWNF